MTLLAWDKRFSVGPPSLDAQHKLLVETLNELHSSVMRGEARNVTSLSLRTLLVYTSNHHAAEEALMAKVQYPDLHQHQTLHRELQQVLETHLARLERGESALSLEFLHFVRDWLSNHIQKVDRAYLPWIVRHATSQTRSTAGSGQTSNESWIEANNGAALGSEAKS
jgi:hemerythrin-like metal-binding protein